MLKNNNSQIPGTKFNAHIPRKRFGQHFLQDQDVIAKICAVINPLPQQQLVEIGPGQGALTLALLKQQATLEVIEIDRDIIPVLANSCKNTGEITIHQADALKFDFKQLVKNNQRLRIVGNLPYNISTPLIFHLLSQATLIKDMHFMLQKEVVERMAAQPGNHNYGRLSVMVQYFCHVETLFIVKPEAFNPPPKVDSAIIRLTPYLKLPCPVSNFDLLQKIVQQAFGQRRKTLRNCLKGLISANELESLAIAPMLRAENLRLADFVKICLYLE